MLHCLVTGDTFLLIHRNGINIGSIGTVRQVYPTTTGLINKFFNNEMGFFVTGRFQHRFQSVQPFLRFLWIVIDKISHIYLLKSQRDKLQPHIVTVFV